MALQLTWCEGSVAMTATSVFPGKPKVLRSVGRVPSRFGALCVITPAAKPPKNVGATATRPGRRRACGSAAGDT